MIKPLDEIEILEKELPALAGSIFVAERKKVLAAGLSVLESDHGALYEVFPNGVRKFVKNIESPTPVVAGTKIKIR